jgi:hypothetical protein
VTSRGLRIGRASGNGQLEAFTLRSQSADLFHRRASAPQRNEWITYFTGTADKLAANLRGLVSEFHLKEIIISTITQDHETRKRSYS